jgi:Alr-MurF fusion protein
MQYSAKELKTILKSSNPLSFPESVCSEVLTDSRNLIHAAKTLFFALKAKRDGEEFIECLYQKGVRNFVIHTESRIPQFLDANYYLVEDTLKALQYLASYHRSQFSIPVIGITGSNGKTIVKEWLYHVLKSEYQICKSPKSFNSQIGVALSVLQLKPHHTLGIFEAGISEPGEMKHLEKMIQPSIGVFTNLGEAHSEGFKSKAEKAKEKAILFNNVEVLITSSEHKGLASSNYVWSASDTKADVQWVLTEKHKKHTLIGLKVGKSNAEFQLPFHYSTAFENAVLCFSVLSYLKKVNPTTLSLFKSLPVISNRLEMVKGMYNSVLLNDSYVADVPSLSYGLQYLNAQAGGKEKWLILSDLEQSALKAEEYVQQVNHLMQQNKVSKLLAVGTQWSSYKDLVKVDADFFPDTLLKEFNPELLADKVVLVKGARRYQFEDIVHRFSLKNHLTRLEINLQALSNNFTKIKSHLPEQTKVMGMVKAFSYGTGIVEVGNALQQAGVDYLAVAYSDEGIQLRKSGVNLPILVMLPETESVEKMIQSNLQPEIHEFHQLEHWVQTLERLGIERYPIHLKLDTGMHRLGFMEPELDAVLNILSNNHTLKIESVFSHFIASDDASKDSISEKQKALFEQMLQKIRSVITYPFLTHIDNSGGIFRDLGKQSMVRLGIGMYGIGAPEDWYLQKVLELKTNISQIKQVKKGETIGYTGNLILKENKTIAIVRIGYADGYKRAFGNGKAYMMVNGKAAPTIGNICMDVTMLDITGIPDIKVGDEVLVMGDHPSVELLSECAGTIPYEILTSISERVKRVYQYE